MLRYRETESVKLTYLRKVNKYIHWMLQSVAGPKKNFSGPNNKTRVPGTQDGAMTTSRMSQNRLSVDHIVRTSKRHYPRGSA